MDHGNSCQSQPDVFTVLLDQIQELLPLQRRYQPHLTLPVDDNGSEVTLGIRDGSAHILRCLKVWYELPSDVLFISVNIMDRFLTKMKVLPKHIACISIASFHTACKIICKENAIPESSDLITISQCKCTLRDLARMESIIINKLDISFEDRQNVPVTSLTFLRLFDEVMSRTKYSDEYKKAVDQFQMFRRLEVIACDGACVNFEASQVALVVLCSTINIGVTRLKPGPYVYINILSLIAFITELQEYCRINDEQFDNCFSSVLKIISQYNSQSGMPHRQRLVWRLSQRTLKHLKPTNKLIFTLPTIEEQVQYRTDEE